MMSSRTRRTAGLILLLYPSVAIGGFFLLQLLQGMDGAYRMNPLLQDYYRAGHAHAGVLLILSLVLLLYVDDALLNDKAKRLVRWTVPLSAVLMSAGFFLSLLPMTSTEPNGLIALVYLGGAVLITGFVALGIGLVRK